MGGYGDRREGPAVVTVAQGQDLVGTPVGGGEQQGSVVGLGTRGGEEHPSVGDARQIADQFGQLDHRLGEIESRRVEGAGGLVGYRSGDFRYVVAEAGGEDPPEEVEVPLAFGVEDVAALPPVHGDGLLVVEGQPGGQDLAVALQEFGVGGHRFLPLLRVGRWPVRARPSPGRCLAVGPGKRPTGS